MRSLLFWFLTGIAATMRAVEGLVKQIQEHVQRYEHQIVYKEFEAAISAWEKRTGRTVERTFRDDVGSGQGSDWKHFAAFLGSREAIGWRKHGMSMEQARQEWAKLGVAEPDMEIEGEERE